MKTIKYILPLLFFTLFLTFASSAQDQVVVPLSKPGEPGKLSLGLVRGSIQVKGYDGKEVIIKYSGARRESEKSKSVTAGGLRRISDNSVGFEVEEENNKVEIGGVSPMQQISFTISVPHNFSLELSAVDGGDIIVENVSGEMEISNVNGGIILNNVSGSAVVNTVNGEIKANFSKVQEGSPMAFSNLNGDIDVTLPANASLTAKMKSERGEVFTDFEMDIKRTDKDRINKSSGSGTYKVSVNNWIYGTINGGGPEYLFKSLQGNIYIRKK